MWNRWRPLDDIINSETLLLSAVHRPRFFLLLVASTLHYIIRREWAAFLLIAFLCKMILMELRLFAVLFGIFVGFFIIGPSMATLFPCRQCKWHLCGFRGTKSPPLSSCFYSHGILFASRCFFFSRSRRLESECAFSVWYKTTNINSILIDICALKCFYSEWLSVLQAMSFHSLRRVPAIVICYLLFFRRRLSSLSFLSFVAHQKHSPTLATRT